MVVEVLDEEAIFKVAVEIPAEDARTTYLQQVCGNDRALLDRVLALLRVSSEAKDFLESPPAAFAATAPMAAFTASPGAQFGHYEIREQIGEGGMGVVYVAEQTAPVRRRVALKIIKPGMDSRDVVARFEAERQALAMMDHPNIAKVYDAGATENGRPYFVMELVQGVPITEYCDQCNLTTRERLELFITVCQAVQHAHQQGIIHRDIKPTNVLVAMQDGRPAPKIIDFGVAKAVGQRLTEHTLTTAFAQMVGSPLYMSPEQAELSPLGVDTRSDIYSLGVLLYELLTSTTPFDKDRLHSAPYDELRRIIREEEPPRPSARLSTLAAERATTIAEHRRTDARRLLNAVCGELDWIVMKSLDKDRSRRYQTAADLALDLQRYLRDEQVAACPPSTGYRLHKFARRNKAALLTAALVAAVLVVGSMASLSQAVRATRAEASATAQFNEATQARTLAETNAKKARQAVDDMYTQVAEQWLAHQPQMEPLQRRFLEKALQFYTEFANQTSHDVDVRLETARAYRRIAEIQHRLGQPRNAEGAFNKTANLLQSLVDEFPNLPEHRAELAAAFHKLGVLFGDTGRSADEEQVHRRALAIEQKLLADFPDTAVYRRDVGRGHWFLGQTLLALDRHNEAEQELRSALHTQTSLVREFPTNPEYRHHLAQSYLRLGLTLRHLNRPDECQQSLAEGTEILETLVSQYPTRPDYRNELANVYYWHVENDYRKLNLPFDQAEQYLKRAIEIQSRLAADYPSVTDYRYDWFRSQKTLGRVLMGAGRYEEAESVVQQAESTAEKLIADAPTVHYYRGGLAFTHIARGEILAATGRSADAEATYRDAISLLSALVAELPAVPQYRDHLRQTYDKLESVLTVTGRTGEAAEIRRKALRLSPSPATSPTKVVRPPDIESDESEITTNN